MQDDDDLPILPGERRVRFGCGALAGAALAFSYVMRQRGVTAKGTLFVCLGVAAVFGVAAALFGERFWRGLWWLR